jgi:polysaccharide biosynthesis/export protein
MAAAVTRWPLLLTALVAACSNVGPLVQPLPPADAAASHYRPQIETAYRLQVGDALHVRSYYDTQLNQDVVVRPDGRISVLLIGELAVAGMTIAELSRDLGDQYDRRLNGTDVVVALARSANMNVYLSGEVRQPALLALDGDVTLLQAIARAGGVLPSANTDSVLLIRSRDDEGTEVRKISIDSILHGQAPDVYLRRRDVVYVPRSDIAQVGQFVDQYINAIVPHAIQFQFGWMRSSVHNNNPAVVIEK